VTVVDTVGALVAAFAPRAVRTSAIELAAAQLGIDANHVRVALSRLRARGKIVAEERGLYRLSEAVQLRQTALGSWRERLSRIVPWSGAYYVALTSWLPKSDRRAARSRARALDRLGFKEHHPGVAVRPANLDLSLEDMTALMRRLGFDDDGDVLVARELSFDPRPAWSEQPDYRARVVQLETGLAEMKADPSADAAVQAFRLANGFIWDAIHDPLLPDEWVDAQGRAAFWRALVEYDRFGRTLWKTHVWSTALGREAVDTEVLATS
jgi:phenylacetic acid degradation operon negative regulatory protein